MTAKVRVAWSGLQSGDEEMEYRRGVSWVSSCRNEVNDSWQDGYVSSRSRRETRLSRISAA